MDTEDRTTHSIYSNFSQTIDKSLFCKIETLVNMQLDGLTGYWRSHCVGMVYPCYL